MLGVAVADSMAQELTLGGQDLGSFPPKNFASLRCFSDFYCCRISSTTRTKYVGSGIRRPDQSSSEEIFSHDKIVSGRCSACLLCPEYGSNVDKPEISVTSTCDKRLIGQDVAREGGECWAQEFLKTRNGRCSQALRSGEGGGWKARLGPLAAKLTRLATHCTAPISAQARLSIS